MRVTPLTTFSAYPVPQFGKKKSRRTEERRQAEEAQRAADQRDAEKLERHRTTLYTLQAIKKERIQQNYKGFGPTLLAMTDEALEKLAADRKALDEDRDLLQGVELWRTAEHLHAMTDSALNDYRFLRPGLEAMNQYVAGNLTLKNLRYEGNGFERLQLLVSNPYNFGLYGRGEPVVRKQLAAFGLKVLEECKIAGTSENVITHVNGKVEKTTRTMKEILEIAASNVPDDNPFDLKNPLNQFQGVMTGLMEVLRLGLFTNVR